MADAYERYFDEVFLVIHAKPPRLRQPESLRSWLYGIVRRAVSPQALTEQAAQKQLLWALLAELDDPKREVFILAEVEEMTPPEIAEALEIPQNTVYSRLRTARAAFEAALARHEARSAFRERA